MITAEDLQCVQDFFSSESSAKFLNLDISSFSPDELFSHSKSSLLIFTQENITGPPRNLSRWTSDSLDLSGEDSVSYLFGGEYLKASSHIFLSNFNLISDHPNAYLWRGRYAFIHQQVLTHPIQSLKDIIIESYESCTHNSLTLIEYSRCLLYYSQYEKAENLLCEAEEKSGIQYNLTGKLGLRTKFQKKMTPQLVLDVRSQSEAPEIAESPQSVLLEEDCPLLERPMIQEPSREMVSIEDQIILMAWVNFFFKSRPAEELQAEVIASYLEKTLEKSMDWLVYSQALLYRSKNQFFNYKYKERSTLQINTLVEQFSDKEPKDRLKYVFAVGYPLRHWLKVDLAEMLMKLGAVMSAFQEFESVCMWEEAVECLIMGNNPNRAAEIARKVLAEKKTARMLCALGDITNDYDYYHEAWEISNHRCTRAQRTLGKREFDKGDYVSAINHYQKALEINPLYPSSWFTLGCAHLKLQQWQEACTAFQRLICIDSNLSEAWNNLAAAHSSLGNFLEAYNALAQGIKHDRQNWKMLENLLILSVKLDKFYTAIECINCLAEVGQFRLMDMDLFEALNRMSEGKVKKLAEVYKNIVNKVSVEPGVWKCYADLVEKNLGALEGFGFEMVAELRVKACRSALAKPLDLENAEKIEKLAQDLWRAYENIESKKIKYEGQLFLNSISKKIKDVLRREPVIQIFASKNTEN